MKLINESKFDETFKIVLLRTFEASMKEVLSDSSSGSDIPMLEAKVAEAILSMASSGQISPGQLQRHAVSQLKAYILTEDADRLYVHRSLRSKP